MAKIKQRTNKGVVGLLIMGIIFLIIGIGVCLIEATTTAESLTKNGKVYQGYHEEANNDESLVVSLVAIDANATDGKTGDLYMALLSDETIAVVELPKGDQRFQKLAKDDNGFLEQPYTLVAKQVKIVVEEQNDLRAWANENGLAGRLNSQSVLSVVDYNNSKLWTFILGGVVSAFGLGCLVAAIIKRRSNAKNYMTLYTIYPELERDLSLIEVQSTYYNDTLKLSVYKEHILFMQSGFMCFDVKQIQWIGYEVTRIRYNFVTTAKTYAFNVLSTTAHKKTNALMSKKVAVQQGKYKEKYEEAIQDFFGFIAEHYPDIKLGETEKPQKARKNLTIDEFLDQQQAAENGQQQK